MELKSRNGEGVLTGGVPARPTTESWFSAQPGEVTVRNFYPHHIERRDFVSRGLVAIAGLSAAPLIKAGSSGPARSDSPSQEAWSIAIPGKNEPGEWMIISGAIYAPDGRSPLEGARLFVYHTDARGIYPADPRDRREPPLSARLRGRMLTRKDGRYEFRSIRPASYPGSRIPAHIHTSVAAEGFPERWIHNYVFAGDPFLPPSDSRRFADAGRFSPLLKLTRGADGIWRGERDIRLGESL